jgi:hypothetical protein
MYNNIITEPTFSVTQHDRKKNLFNIFLNNKQLLYSITKTKIIQNYTILDTGTSIMLKASSIKTYEEFKKSQKNTNKIDRLPHSILLKMIYYLSKQLSYLITNHGKCFYTYEPNNIIVIDDNIFLCISQEHLTDIKNNDIYIYSPISTSNLYLSPELSSAKILPIIINYKTIFYSLGLLVSENLSSGISETKLNYFLERCLNKDPCERYII